MRLETGSTSRVIDETLRPGYVIMERSTAAMSACAIFLMLLLRQERRLIFLSQRIIFPDFRQTTYRRQDDWPSFSLRTRRRSFSLSLGCVGDRPPRKTFVCAVESRLQSESSESARIEMVKWKNERTNDRTDGRRTDGLMDGQRDGNGRTGGT